MAINKTILSIYFAFLILLLGCNPGIKEEKKTNPTSYISYFSDLETVIDEEFIGTQNQNFQKGHFQSSEHSFSGKHSVKVYKKQPYALDFSLTNLDSGQYIVVP